MEKQYAQALWEMVEGGMEPKKAVDALHAHLKERGREALMPRVGYAFERLAERDRQRNTLTLTVAREKDTARARSEIKALLAKLDVDARDVAIEEDETLIGGWRLEGKEMLLDASYKKQLLDIFSRATV